MLVRSELVPACITAQAAPNHPRGRQQRALHFSNGYNHATKGATPANYAPRPWKPRCPRAQRRRRRAASTGPGGGCSGMGSNGALVPGRSLRRAPAGLRGSSAAAAGLGAAPGVPRSPPPPPAQAPGRGSARELGEGQDPAKSPIKRWQLLLQPRHFGGAVGVKTGVSWPRGRWAGSWWGDAGQDAPTCTWTSSEHAAPASFGTVHPDLSGHRGSDRQSSPLPVPRRANEAVFRLQASSGAPCLLQLSKASIQMAASEQIGYAPLLSAARNGHGASFPEGRD